MKNIKAEILNNDKLLKGERYVKANDKNIHLDHYQEIDYNKETGFTNNKSEFLKEN